MSWIWLWFYVLCLVLACPRGWSGVVSPGVRCRCAVVNFGVFVVSWVWWCSVFVGLVLACPRWLSGGVSSGFVAGVLWWSAVSRVVDLVSHDGVIATQGRTDGAEKICFRAKR